VGIRPGRLRTAGPGDCREAVESLPRRRGDTASGERQAVRRGALRFPCLSTVLLCVVVGGWGTAPLRNTEGGALDCCCPLTSCRPQGGTASAAATRATEVSLPKDSAVIVAAGGHRSAIVNRADEFASWGDGWPGSGTGPRNRATATPQWAAELSSLCLTQVDLGERISVALDVVGKVYTWGWPRRVKGAERGQRDRSRTVAGLGASTSEGGCTLHVRGLGSGFGSEAALRRVFGARHPAYY
jgi:hypothetical protein